MMVDLCGGSLSLGTHGRAMQRSTDEAGRFSLRFDLDPAGAVGGEIRVEVPLRDGPARATVRLPETAFGGSFETGDVVVARAMLLAAGQVVDDGGVRSRMHESRTTRLAGGGRPRQWPSRMPTAASSFEVRRPTRSSPSPQSSRAGSASLPRSATAARRTSASSCTRSGGLDGALAGIDRLRLRLQPPIQVVVAGPAVDAVARVVGGSHPAGMELPVFSDGRFSASGLLPGRYSVLFLGLGVREPLSS